MEPDPNMNATSQVAKLEPDSPQSPGADSQMSFDVYESRLSGSGDSCLGALLPNSASKIGFLPDYPTKDGDRMVPGYSRRIRQLSVCLVLFITVSLVMAGLLVWRVIYYDSGYKAEATSSSIKEVDRNYTTYISY